MRKPLVRRTFFRVVATGMVIASFCGGLEAHEDALTVPIHRGPVDSQSIASVGYHADLRVLEIQFTSGALYRYFAVPASVFEGLQKSDSKGRYFSQCIRGRFEYRRLAGVTP
jgi:hypothetical protein